MVKRIKQKSRKQAHDPNFEYQPMTKVKEDTRNKTQTAADVPKPTEGTDEEKEKNNEKKKEEIETETEPATEPEQKEGAHEAKQQQKEKMQEDIGQEKAVAAETNPKSMLNKRRHNFKYWKVMMISRKNQSKTSHSSFLVAKQTRFGIAYPKKTKTKFSSSTTHNQVLVSGLNPYMGMQVIDAFSEKQLALQPTIEEFEKNDLTFARNPYAGRSYIFSTLINH
ncbi:unnamed protein product [Camellia sinensis]